MASSFELVIPADQLRAKAAEGHIDPNATSGTLPEVDGVQLSYIVAGTNVVYHPFSATPNDYVRLEFTVVKKPFYVPVDAIRKHVAGLLGV